ncbi:MAG TPA: SPOR domain-containing protein [Bacteroidales bacterium]|nr:SPOR domain-containing protein [Bacteroidales bacterium]
MIKRILVLFALIVVLSGIAGAQGFIETSALFDRKDKETGKLAIVQDPAIDTLISRYILMSNRILQENDGVYGMSGYRIQIYNSSNRNAREESKNIKLEFMDKFPDMASSSYQKYSEPGWFKVRVGDFRTKTEAMKAFQRISRVYPSAYLVPDIINFPELNKK